MKKLICLAVTLLVSGLIPVFGQPIIRPPTPMRVSTPEEQIILTEPKRITDPNSTPSLTKFNLDFSGGTPGELVKAIEKATGKPLNVIIRPEDADTQLPPLKMTDVDIKQLFSALLQVSIKQVAIVSSTYNGSPSSYSTFNAYYAFETKGPVTDNAIWYFHVEKPTLPPVKSNEKVCKFYPLLEYLNRGFTVDDITTAIKTGWKMSGETAPAELSYHKETKLLIAYGEPDKLKTIEYVLNSLPQQSAVTTQTDIANLSLKIGQLRKQADETQAKLNGLIQQLKPVKDSGSAEEKSGK